MAARSERGIARVLDKLEISINNGNYYEAHQMYRTLYFRYLGQKKYDEVLNLLCKGSKLLLEKNQQGSGADLALLLVEVLVKAETKPCIEWIEKIAELLSLMSPTIPERELFLTNSVKWSMDSNKKGHPYLHKKIAEIFWKEQKFSVAHRHFLHSNDGRTYAIMLVELHLSRGLKSEIDLFVAQAVLQLLCLRNYKMAEEVFNQYIISHPNIQSSKTPPFGYRLINFVWFILKSLQQKDPHMFRFLRDWYSTSIRRDPNYSEYLDNIGKLYLGLPIPQGTKKSNSMLGGLLKTIIGDDIDSSDDEICLQQNAPAPDLD